MGDFRRKDQSWKIGHGDGMPVAIDQAQLAVLMDIRTELKQLNAVLSCSNFVRIPTTLRSIDRKLTKPKRKSPDPRKGT